MHKAQFKILKILLSHKGISFIKSPGNPAVKFTDVLIKQNPLGRNFKYSAHRRAFSTSEANMDATKEQKAKLKLQ